MTVPAVVFVEHSRRESPRLPKLGPTTGGLSASADVVVRVAERGASKSDAASTVVFLHNGGANREIWEPVIDRLGPSIRALSIDLPGYGESDAPSSGFRRSDYADVIEQFLDHYVDDPSVVLVGNCMGSAFAWTVADRRPDRIGALVLINPLTKQTARRSVAGRLLPIPVAIDLGRVVGWLRLPGPLSTLALVPQFGFTGLRRRLWWRHRKLATQWRDSGRVRPVASLFHDIDSYTELDMFRRPEYWPWTAMVWGAANWALSPKAGARLADGLRPDRNIRLRGAGHLAMLEEPDKVAGIVECAVAERALTGRCDVSSAI
ncbi:putative hydrolase [Gordonia effusa NBRC 100432]|uniref:Putative hydrolase n=1 Tax=Gordonia effusa NBRC 100432 TaxID=1077974 RepID=H0R3X1_9ACTN|nr:alpha/beta fold hydrolase [Gordonia effusa]GAB19772.1 putative hydrolase [Gordonia effusa NBRC 100432]